MEAPVSPVRRDRGSHGCPRRHVGGQVRYQGRVGAEEREREHAQGAHSRPRILLAHRRTETADVLGMGERVLAQHDVAVRIIHVDARADSPLIEDLQHLGGDGGAEGVLWNAAPRAELPADGPVQEDPGQGGYSVRLHDGPGAAGPAPCCRQHRDRSLAKNSKGQRARGCISPLPSQSVPSRSVTTRSSPSEAPPAPVAPARRTGSPLPASLRGLRPRRSRRRAPRRTTSKPSRR